MFKDELKQARAKTGLTQKQLADALQIPFYTLMKWEQGNRTPAIYVQQSILKQIKPIEK